MKLLRSWVRISAKYRFIIALVSAACIQAMKDKGLGFISEGTTKMLRLEVMAAK